MNYDCVYRGNTPEGRKGTRCRRVAPGQASYYSSVQIEFEDGFKLIVNRNTVRAATLCHTRPTQIVMSDSSSSRKSRA
jgi:hypothetical protein